MKIPTFTEFINEGLWSKGLERAQTGKKRQEETTDFDLYVKDIEWVDMGHPDVLFAKFDYPKTKYEIENEDVLFSLDEIIEIEKNLPENVSVMNRKQIEYLKKNCNIKGSSEKSRWDKSIKIVVEHDGEEIYFNILHKYSFMLNETLYYMRHMLSSAGREWNVQKASIGLAEKPTLLGRTTTGYEFQPERKKYFLKLVKNK